MGTLPESLGAPPVNMSASYAFPLTSAQLRLWFLDQLAPNETSYLIPWALRIRGPLDAAALQFSLNEIYQRHEIFRTRYVANGDDPVQLVTPEAELPLPLVSLTQLDAGAAEAEALRLARVEAQTPIVLAEGPMLRAKLVRIAEQDHVLLLTTHHICFDGWSRGIFLRELGFYYQTSVSGKPAELPELPIQYGDFAVWQQEHFTGDYMAGQLGYWKEQLKDLPLSVALPSDRPRPAVQTSNGKSRHFTLPKSLLEQVKLVSQREGVTPYMMMLAAFQVLVARYTGLDDIVLGTPTANRNRPELEGIIGLFANTLVLRTQLGGDPAFRGLLARVKETALSAYAHEDMPFEQLVQELSPERSLSQSPLFQILFSLRNTPVGDFRLADLPMEWFGGSGEASKYDLSMYLEERSEGLGGKIEYNTDLYDESTIERILRHFETLLQSAIEAPEKRLSELEMLGTAERKQLLVDWNSTVREYPRDLCVHQLFERQTGVRGQAIAVEFGDEKITYADLNAQANRLAHALRAQGVGVGQRVGLFIERSVAMFVGLLGIQKSGAAYVPLDPAYPAERVRATLEAGGITLLVSQENLLSALPDYDGKVICLDRDRALLEKQSGENPQSGVTPDDLIYVIFTSGSTGKPKGVELGHRGVVNLLDWMREELQFGENGVFPALASFAFDMSIPELYLALAAGGTVALAPKQLAADGEELAKFLRRHGATLVHATPTTWSLLLEAGFTGENLTRCIGAEPLPSELFGRLMDAAPGTPLYNFYGPTETTVWSTFERFDSAADRIVIGRPLANTQLYIVDGDGNPVPVGVPGELLIGGDGVAKGYLNQPELTAEKFIPDTFSRKAGARLYRTGDLGRYLPDGRVEFAGRVDHQVKIRGFRIELGEIETVLTQMSTVRECVVLAREDEAGDKRLVAYVVAEPGAAVATREMREWVKQRLPEYMVPSAFVVLERMPLSPNGKVDRKALPAPEVDRSAVVGTMENPVDEMIANIWAEVLKTAEITQTANFFELGGHSLLATKVVARIRQAMHVNLPLGAIFDSPTVAGLAAKVKTLMREEANLVEAPLVPANWGATPKPLSFSQKRLWFLDQLEPNSPFYNVPLAMRLVGPFDIVAMERALDGVIARHESLRTTLQLQGDQPAQVVAPQMQLPLVQIDLSTMPEAEREEEARRLTAEEARRPFNLSKGPLFRAMILTLAPEDHVFMVNLHHAISDGWSLGVLVNDITALYESFRAGTPSQLQPLGITYGDFAIWQRDHLESGALKQQLEYWKAQLAGAPPAIELPTDRTRPPVQTFHGSKRVMLFRPELLEGLKTLSRSEGATLFITLLAAFNVLLSRYSGQNDIVVGTANACRHQPDTEKLIGYFANTVVLRNDLDGSPTFRELIHRVRETTLNAFANQDVPFERLVEELNPVRDMSRSPVFQVMIIQQNAFQHSSHFGSLKSIPFSAVGGVAKVDLLLSVSDDDGKLRCALEYNTDLYDADTIDRMLENLGTLLDAAVTDPAQHVTEMSILPVTQLEQQLVDWNATTAEYPRDKAVYQLIEEQAQLAPDAPAVIFGNRQLTYGELNRQANQLARYLQTQGVKAGDRVGVYLERSLSLMVALVAVQKTGAAYVPLDPAYPVERLRLVMEDAGIACMISFQSLMTGMPEYTGPMIRLAREAEAIAAESDENLPAAGSSEDSMYVIFTSGSTGRPKGVEVPHRAVVNLLIWMAQELSMGPGDVFPALASFAFDMSVPELYLPLVSGGTVLLAERHMGSNGEELAALLRKHHATVVHATPTTWSLLLDAGFTGAGLKRCIGAEGLPRELFVRLMHAAEGTPLINFYGPTETTVWSTFHRFTSADEVVVVGRPLANTQVYLLDSNLQPVPVGVSGGIYISGDGVTRGYFGRPDLTAEKFIPNPFASEGKLYYTGDVGRYLSDGRIEYIARADNQVKLRGFRIELGEIETLLASHPSVRECVVIAREDQPGNKFLAAYVVAGDPSVAVDVATLRAYLKERLPDYMVPTGWLVLDRLPLSANGKVDRKALPVPGAVAVGTSSGRVPRTPVEIRLATIWEEVLKVGAVSLDDDFFNLGGHSLLAVEMITKAREAFGCELPLTALFGAPRLGDLAKVIQTEGGKQPFRPLIPIRKTGSKPPLFCISRPNVNALGFVFLARHLSPEQPVIGLQTQMDKDGMYWVYDQKDYEEIAREYVRVLRETYPEGPYLLTGYCEGAHIAFEMAREMERLKLEVGMIAILDVWPVENTAIRSLYILRNYWRVIRKIRRQKINPVFHRLTGSIFRRDQRDDSQPIGAPVERTAPQTPEERRLIYEQIVRRYWPGPDFVPTKYSGKLTLFRTKKQHKFRIWDYKMGWGQRALAGVDVYMMQGWHPHLLREPAVIELGTRMQACIDQALAGHPSLEAKPESTEDAVHVAVEA